MRCPDVGCIAPDEGEIRWEITADSLMELAVKHWAILYPALIELERRSKGERALSHQRAMEQIATSDKDSRKERAKAQKD